jgi:hypothetical protein
MAKKKKQSAGFKPDGWNDPWKYIQAAPNSAFSQQLQDNPPPQPPPVDPAYEAWQKQFPALQGNVYAEYGNPELGADAPFAQHYGYQGTQLLNNLGLTEQGQIDPNNSYGQASLLQRSYQQGQRATSGSYAARGMLRDSSAQQTLDQGTFQYNRGMTGLQQGLQSGLHGITQAALGGLNDLNTQNIDRLGQHTTYLSGIDPVPTQLGSYLYQQAGSPQPKQAAPQPPRPALTDPAGIPKPKVRKLRYSTRRRR